MMINKRMLSMVSHCRPYIAAAVVLQWVSLVANIALMGAIAVLLESFVQQDQGETLLFTILVGVCAVTVRVFCTIGASKMSYLSSREVKKTLRSLCCVGSCAMGSRHAIILSLLSCWR